MKKIILSAAVIAFAGAVTASANNFTGSDTLTNRQDTASFNRDTALFSMDTASFKYDTASFKHDTALFAADTAAFRDAAAFNHDTATRISSDTAALVGGAYGVQSDSTQKTPVKLETLPEPVKSTLQSGELKQWSPSAAFMIKTDTSAYYQIYVQKGAEGKNVNIDEKGAVIPQ